jgi:hypothetical protein
MSWYSVVFCPSFFLHQFVPTLASKISQFQNNKKEQKKMENFQMTQVPLMLHETWHFKNLVSSPITDDYAYKAQPVWDMAKNKGTNCTQITPASQNPF